MKKKILIFFAVSLTLIVADQVTKQYFREYFGVINTAEGFSLKNYESIKVIGDFLQFTYVENEGMAFGISFGAGKYLLSLFSILASVALIIYLYKLSNFSVWIKIGISLILAGAVGNLIDRVFYGLFFNYAPLFWGRVIDFIQVDIPDINFWVINYTHFPIFNIADSCVTVGVSFLILFHKRIPEIHEVFPTWKFLKKEHDTDTKSEIPEDNKHRILNDTQQ